MAGVIKSGDSGNTARVFRNRLNVHSTAETEEVDALEDGDAYNINTGSISLAAATATLYLKNNEDKDLIINALVVGVGTPDGGNTNFTGETVIELIRNPTAGTLIDSTPTNTSINENRNFGSTNTLSATTYQAGASGDAISDGSTALYFFQNGAGRLFAGINILLPKGSSIGVRVTPAIDATTLPVYTAFVCYLEQEH